MEQTNIQLWIITVILAVWFWYWYEKNVKK